VHLPSGRGNHAHEEEDKCNTKALIHAATVIPPNDADEP
jgi:hypothetical protein